MTRASILLILALVAAAPAAPAAPAERAPHLDAALARARETGADIVLFQRGSDWNVFGERVFQHAWNTDVLARTLGPGFLLVTIDDQKTIGAPPVDPYIMPGNCAPRSWQPGPPERLARLVSTGSPPPPSALVAVKAESGADYQKQSDGAFLVAGISAAPLHDVLALTVKPTISGRVVRIDFPPHASLPMNGPGRADGNGNFAISAIQITAAGKPITPDGLWSDKGSAWHLLLPQPPGPWNADAGKGNHRVLFASFPTPIAAGSDLTITLTCASQWGRHVPGHLRATVLDDDRLANDIHTITTKAITDWHNRDAWIASGFCPRIALLDKDGRTVAALESFADPVYPEALATGIRALHAKRVARDELLAQADKAEGPRRALLIHQALAPLGIGSSNGHKDCYKSLVGEINKADPQDSTGAQRWRAFSLGGPSPGYKWPDQNNWAAKLKVDPKAGKSDPTEADFREALACVDRELADPRNQILGPDHLQVLAAARIAIYERWKKEAETIRAREEVIAISPGTILATLQQGILGANRHGATPFLSYGWGTKHLSPGEHSWTLTDTAYLLSNPAVYKLTATHAKGTSTITLRKVRVVSDKGTLAEATASPAEVGPGKSAEAMLDCSQWQPGTNYRVVIEYTAPQGPQDSTGAFSFTPMFTDR